MTQKAYAKVNIFLKIVGTRDHYHELISRFMRVENLYDTITFEKKITPSNSFELLGDFGCIVEKNTIYKAYQQLLLTTQEEKIKTFFNTHRILVLKQIPEFAGLGGGSSDAAAFLTLTNRVLNLGLTKEELASIGTKIGADVPFFIYNYPSANVNGIGEIVKPFDETPLKLETITPKVQCDTTQVYQKYRSDYIQKQDKNLAHTLSTLCSNDILGQYNTQTLNDLFSPCMDLYQGLHPYHQEGWFFSGSGSTFFRINNG
ncbi:MAG: 4-(cytidine 5'-diphospho)-2-C-methyl-D-erythritol kinase [Epsilonproteobacteria bacterium]|nr:4-(cytidine 5'-diphospho)-2-C-methyl-D-erythritol kinase [Campylobacterota bacterium]